MTRQVESQLGRVLNTNRGLWVRDEPVSKLLEISHPKIVSVVRAFAFLFFSTVYGAVSPGTVEQVSGSLLGSVSLEVGLSKC